MPQPPRIEDPAALFNCLFVVKTFSFHQLAAPKLRNHIRLISALCTRNMSKATPKAGITLLSKADEGGLKFLHSPSASGDVALKHKVGSKLTLGVGFSVCIRDSFAPSSGRVRDRALMGPLAGRRTRP